MAENEVPKELTPAEIEAKAKADAKAAEKAEKDAAAAAEAKAKADAQDKADFIQYGAKPIVIGRGKDFSPMEVTKLGDRGLLVSIKGSGMCLVPGGSLQPDGAGNLQITLS